jgi:hypothetical protein
MICECGANDTIVTSINKGIIKDFWQFALPEDIVGGQDGGGFPISEREGEGIGEVDGRAH